MFRRLLCMKTFPAVSAAIVTAAGHVVTHDSMLIEGLQITVPAIPVLPLLDWTAKTGNRSEGCR